MNRWFLLAALICRSILSAMPAWAADPVVIQDYEQGSPLPKLWVVGIPNANAAVQFSADHPFAGRQSLKLHYHFTGGGQYMGLTQDRKIYAPIHKLRARLFGDNSGTGYGLYLTDAGGETHKFRNAETMKIDFQGWKEIVIDLDAPHENWGGDKNGKIEYPISDFTFEISTPGKAVESDLFLDAVSVDSDVAAEDTLNPREVSVISPEYCAEITGDTTIKVAARGFQSVTAKCWQAGPGFGSDATVAMVKLDEQGQGSFVFPADQHPHGPITVRISGIRGQVHDNCYLQLYNRGGVSWNEGLPQDPPAAAGMKLLFADDFTGPLSISSKEPKSTYYDHKPPHGSQDFSEHRFTGREEPGNPFAHMDSYLRIRASDKTKSAGIISSVKSDGSGIKASIPCYFECRFIGPNVIGAWPAFWLLTDNLSDTNQPCDELDIIEAYGGEGPGHPNAKDAYMITPHAWNQKGTAAEALTDQFYKTKARCQMSKFGIPSTWYESPHTYGCKITETDTIYYCDNIEVTRHETLPISKQKPHFFLINLATGGGWPIDLSRTNGTADMYVDFVRVYQGNN